MASDVYNIDGVRLEDLQPTTTLNDETVFLVGIDKVCYITSLRSLRASFAGDPASGDKDNVYYNAIESMAARSIGSPAL